ncbi:hypothetical protein LEMLEM_LOCUS5366 [Lemmus lemmus]
MFFPGVLSCLTFPPSHPPGSSFCHGQKRIPDLIKDGCEPPCGCQESNSGPSEEQAMLLTTEPSLQPDLFFF